MAVILIVSNSFTGNAEQAYVEQIQKKREERAKYLREDATSPFVQSGTPFKPLQHYPVNPDYKVRAKVEKMESRMVVSLKNSNGTTSRYLKYAWLHFDIHGESQQLLVLKPMFGPGFFLGFADETSGDTTYGGGRYLDIESLKGDRVTLDFNLAYNPYCAYLSDFQCPLPPRENILDVKIEAGEKNYPG